MPLRGIRKNKKFASEKIYNKYIRQTLPIFWFYFGIPWFCEFEISYFLHLKSLFFIYIYKTVQLVHAYCGFMDKIEVKYQLGRKNRASCLEKEHFVLISVTHHCTLSSVITCCILKWKATKEKICKRYPHFVKTSFSYFMIFTPDTQGISWLRGLEKLIGSPPSSVHNWSLSDRDQDAKRGKERWLEPFSC